VGTFDEPLSEVESNSKKNKIEKKSKISKRVKASRPKRHREWAERQAAEIERLEKEGFLTVEKEAFVAAAAPEKVEKISVNSWRRGKS
jgi:hypothetical protein